MTYIACIYASSIIWPIMITPLVNIDKMEPPHPGFCSYEITNKKLFWFTYFHQIIVFQLSTVIAMTYDTMVAGCMLQLCSHIEVLKHAVEGIPFLQKDFQYGAISKIVKYHCTIWR